jgi:hypothetical protein
MKTKDIIKDAWFWRDFNIGFHDRDLRRISNEGIWIWKQTCVEHFEDIIALGKQENGEYERDWEIWIIVFQFNWKELIEIKGIRTERMPFH